MLDQYPRHSRQRANARRQARLAASTFARLKQNRVRSPAAVYYNDMYVHREFSEETAGGAQHQALGHQREYEHTGCGRTVRRFSIVYPDDRPQSAGTAAAPAPRTIRCGERSEGAARAFPAAGQIPFTASGDQLRW